MLQCCHSLVNGLTDMYQCYSAALICIPGGRAADVEAGGGHRRARRAAGLGAARAAPLPAEGPALPRHVRRVKCGRPPCSRSRAAVAMPRAPIRGFEVQVFHFARHTYKRQALQSYNASVTSRAFTGTTQPPTRSTFAASAAGERLTSSATLGTAGSPMPP